MSQAFTNPKSSNPPENNYPLKVENSKLISLFAKKKQKTKKKTDMIIRYPEQIKCHTDPSFIKSGYLTLLFITLKFMYRIYIYLFSSAHVEYTF